jgi:hypothetical protein
MVANTIAWCLRREYCLFLDDFSRLFIPKIYDRGVHSIGKTSFVILTRELIRRYYISFHKLKTESGLTAAIIMVTLLSPSKIRPGEWGCTSISSVILVTAVTILLRSHVMA